MHDDLISREETLTAFADYVGSGMSMDDYDALWDIVAKMPTVKQEPKFIAKSDGTIEQIKNCDDCLFKKEWEKIGKLISVVLEKQIEQEPKTGHWIGIDGKPSHLKDGMTTESVWCSECGKWLTASDEYSCDGKYCPSCGARMVEPQERSDKE